LPVYQKYRIEIYKDKINNLTLKFTAMNQLINDIKSLIKNNWKTILLIVFIIWLILSYKDIKLGIMDAWEAK
jgi:hypothetical protein